MQQQSAQVLEVFCHAAVLLDDIYSSNSNSYNSNKVCAIGRYEFFEEMWMHRKGKTPRSSVEFALLEQKLDPTGRMLQSSKNLMYTESSVNTKLGVPAVMRNPHLQKESTDGKLAGMRSAV